MKKSDVDSQVSPYTAHTQGRGKRKRGNYVAHNNVNDRAVRQHSRYASLKTQFNKCARSLIGRTAMIVLPGQGCQHSAEQFRPVHWERRWRSRPFFVTLSVGREESRFTLRLSGATSFYDEKSQKIRYVKTLIGQAPCEYDYLRQPERGAPAPVLDGAANHVLFTAANNLLQELVNTADRPVTELALPKLVCLVEGRHIPIDHKKLDKLAAKMPESLREQYKQSLAKEAEIVSLGTRFGHAAVMPDAAIQRAFREKRAYEDYRDLLGAETANPARKILMAANPASSVLAQNGLEPGWDAAAHEKVIAGGDPDMQSKLLAEHENLYEKLLAEMRGMLPLPELVSDSDLLDALAEPHKPLRMSRALTDLIEQDPGAVVRAMRSTMPRGAALREHVRDDELLSAARNPYSPMLVGAYSKIQIVNTEDFDSLPDYATGSFWVTQPGVAAQIPVWHDDNNVEPVECAQLQRERIAE